MVAAVCSTSKEQLSLHRSEFGVDQLAGAGFGVG